MTKYKNNLRIEDLVEISKALSDPHRVRALAALQGGELCVCRIVELLELAPSTVSKHMSILKQVGLVASRKEGRWIYYRLPDQIEGPILQSLGVLMSAISEDEVIRNDNARIKSILSQSPESLCRKQRNKHGLQ